MTTQSEIDHYQQQIKTLLGAKKRRLDELKEINERLAKMGLKSSPGPINPNKPTQFKPAKAQSKAQSKAQTKAQTKPKSQTQTSKSQAVKPKPKAAPLKARSAPKGKVVEGQPPPVKATVKSMKAYLDLKGHEYNSHATRKDLEQIIRKHNLVRKIATYHEECG